MTNNKQQTAVDWFSVRRDVLEIEVRLGKLSPIEYAEELTKAEQQAKEMEKQQSQAYAEFCVTCDRNKLPLLDFESWLKLPSKEDSAEATLDEYNRMEEEWEMENYNQMKEEQSE
jgi:hypothetical protein